MNGEKAKPVEEELLHAALGNLALAMAELGRGAPALEVACWIERAQDRLVNLGVALKERR